VGFYGFSLGAVHFMPGGGGGGDWVAPACFVEGGGSPGGFCGAFHEAGGGETNGVFPLSGVRVSGLKPLVFRHIKTSRGGDPVSKIKKKNIQLVAPRRDLFFGVGAWAPRQVLLASLWVEIRRAAALTGK
jgi:hypothetical protein